jgi:hypothetical protein
VLDGLGEDHPRVEQCGGDLAEAVVPAVAGGVGERDVGIDVGAGRVEHQRRLVLER